MSTFDATHSQWCMPEMMTMMTEFMLISQELSAELDQLNYSVSQNVQNAPNRARSDVFKSLIALLIVVCGKSL